MVGCRLLGVQGGRRPLPSARIRLWSASEPAASMLMGARAKVRDGERERCYRFSSSQLSSVPQVDAERGTAVQHACKVRYGNEFAGVSCAWHSRAGKGLPRC